MNRAEKRRIFKANRKNYEWDQINKMFPSEQLPIVVVKDKARMGYKRRQNI